jgi:hypothetical protein
MPGNFIREQKSVWFFLEESTTRGGAGSLYSRLDNIYADVLPRDIPLNIMPIGGTSAARRDFAVSITPADEQLIRLITTASSEDRGSYPSTNIKRAVCNFVHRTASRLLQRGKVVFEIVLLRDQQTKNLVGCDLFEINVRTLTIEKNRVFQRVPPQVAAERKVPTIIDLDIDRLAIFSMPSAFRDLAETKQALAHLGGGSLAQMYDASRADNKLGYDIKEHIRAEHLAIAAATRSIGWSANQNLYKLFTEYYVLHRQLVFQGFVITLRESILQTLNEAVGRIAQHFGTTAELSVNGLPTLEDVNRAKNELINGGRTFVSVLDDFSLL